MALAAWLMGSERERKAGVAAGGAGICLARSGGLAASYPWSAKDRRKKLPGRCKKGRIKHEKRLIHRLAQP